jgi:hypothetical protein
MSMTTDFWGDRHSQDTINAAVPVPVSSQPVKPASRFGKFLQTLFTTMAGDAEPKIWQTTSRNGVMIWNVYDPTTKESTRFTTEADVRSWLEQRHCH